VIELNEPTPFELDNPSARAPNARKKAQAILRAKRLARPITAKQISHFEKYLRPVCCGPYECWIHTGKNIVKGKDGRGTYVRVWLNNELVLAHRLAFRIATGTPFADIQDYQISHTNTCVGYRCVRPDHLFKGAKKYRDHGNIAQRERDKAALKEEMQGYRVSSLPRILPRSWLYPKLLPAQAAEPEMRLLVPVVVVARPMLINRARQRADDYAGAFHN